MLKTQRHKKSGGLDFQGLRCAPQVGLEPTTLRLTAECSAIELLRNMESGSDLLSRAVSSQVPSALKGLTSVFGMGTGVTPSLSPPERVIKMFAVPGLRPFSAIRLLNSRPFLPPFSSCRSRSPFHPPASAWMFPPGSGPESLRFRARPQPQSSPGRLGAASLLVSADSLTSLPALPDSPLG